MRPATTLLRSTRSAPNRRRGNLEGSITGKELAEDRLYGRAVKAFKRSCDRRRLPHFVLVEHLGLEPRTGGEKSNFFSPHAIHWNAAAKRVQPVLARAIGFSP